MTARLAERRRALRRMRLRTMALVTVALAALAGVVYLTAFSPVLALRTEDVRIAGASEWVDTASVWEVVSARDGEPLLLLHTGELVQQVEQITGVRSATVHREWPNGLRVQITPRVPIATVAGAEGYLVLDAEAVQLDVTAAPRDDLPLIDVEVGEDSTAARLTAVVTVLSELPQDLLDEVEGVGAISVDHVEMELDDGSLVVWGSAEENELKAQVLATLRQVPAGMYDVSAPRHPITRD